ncbi:uncharacterized protein LOC143668361 [Tamandua tetradactyla]|uniref:uncharacterized protein LOC143668361 n=1 Tax=Tamandua tetradactyla TaxID=48850 RepID=UPI004053B55C
MAERPQLREATATGTGPQVTRAEPHLPGALQPFTVARGGRSSAESSPRQLILNFPSPAPLSAPGLSPRLRHEPGLQRLPVPTLRVPVAGGRGLRLLIPRVPRVRKEPKCAQPPRWAPPPLGLTDSQLQRGQLYANSFQELGLGRSQFMSVTRGLGLGLERQQRPGGVG